MTYPGQLSFQLLCMSLYHVQDQRERCVAAELDHWLCRVLTHSYIIYLNLQNPHVLDRCWTFVILLCFHCRCATSDEMVATAVPHGSIRNHLR